MVTKQERQVYELVLERDRVMSWEHARTIYEALQADPATARPTKELVPLAEWLMTDPWICVAPVIDLSVLGTCSGAMERDHVHSHTGGTKAKRPPTSMDNLVILCHHHHQDGWATSHRPEIRTYIKEANERWMDERH